MPTIYFDAHNHLQNYASEGKLDGALKMAEAAGVGVMLCNGTRVGDWEKVAEIAAKRKGVVPCFGLHPWMLKVAAPGWLVPLEAILLRVPSCVGEIGLDGGKNANSARQATAFVAQLRLAKKLGRPTCLHCVQAWGLMLEMLEEEKPGPFLFHSYGGSPEMIPGFAALGGYFSFSGAILDPKREKLRRALLATPPDRLLFETESPEPDAPGWRAGPAGIVEVAAAAAAILGKPAEELAALTLANGNKFIEHIGG